MDEWWKKVEINWFNRHHHAKLTLHTGNRAQNTARGATAHCVRSRRSGKYTTIARSIQIIVYGRLALIAQCAAKYQRLAHQHTGIIGQVSRQYIIRTIDHNIEIFHDVACILGGQTAFVRYHLDQWINSHQLVFKRRHLRQANVAFMMTDLAMQIRRIDSIEVDETNVTDSGAAQI